MLKLVTASVTLALAVPAAAAPQQQPTVERQREITPAEGRGVGYLGDGKIDLKPGMSVFVPPFVRHEITAAGDEPMEGVVVLYGDNSDFAFGTSYPAFLQDLAVSTETTLSAVRKRRGKADIDSRLLRNFR